MDSLKRQPLFWAAMALCAAIGTLHFSFPKIFYPHDKNHVVRFVNPVGAGLVPALGRQPQGSSGQPQGSPLLLGGVIVSEIETRETFYGQKKSQFVLEAKKLWLRGDSNSLTVKGRVKVYAKQMDEALSYGDEMVIKGELDFPTGLRNPGGFDQKAYLARQGIHAVFFTDKRFSRKVTARHRANAIVEQALCVKSFLSKSLERGFSPRDAGFLKALFLGERSGLEEDFKDLFMKTGTVHILAVSGFNIGFLGLVLFFLLKPFPVARNVKLGLTLLVIWGYCLLVGWQAPVLRAAWMATFFILGELMGRKINPLNTLGFSALFILCLNPLELWDVGFQLSFLAVLALIKILPLFVEKPVLWPNEKRTLVEKAVQWVKELFWISFVCVVVTLPITVQNFYSVSPIALLANLVVVPATFLIFFLGFIYFLTFAWLPPFLSPVPILIKFLMKGMVAVLYAMENLPGACWIAGKLPFILWAALVAGIFYFLFWKKFKTVYARAFVIVIFIVSIFAVQEILKNFQSGFRVTFLDVGQGDAIYLEFPKGGNLLVDAGGGVSSDKGRFAVVPFLKYKGVRTLDGLVASHPQEDHIGGMFTVLEELRVKKFFEAGVPYRSRLFESLKRKIFKEKAGRIVLKQGSVIQDFKDVEIQVLNPSQTGAPHRNINDDSLVLKVIYKNSSILLTGDVQEEAMQEILNGSPLRCTVLKVPHHGARLGPAGERFVGLVSPSISVTSVGKRNPFGHPAPKTLQVLDSVGGNRSYRTDRSGAVEVVMGERGVRVVTQIS